MVVRLMINYGFQVKEDSNNSINPLVLSPKAAIIKKKSHEEVRR